MDHFRITALSLLLWATANTFPVASFQPSSSTSTFGHRYVKHSSVSTTTLFLTPLPKDISPFDKTASKGRDIQGDLRKLATTAFENALCDNQNDNKPMLLELEFPPLIGGEQSKTQFDDFDSKTNFWERSLFPCDSFTRSRLGILTTLVSFFFLSTEDVQELNQNQNWCVQWLPTLANLDWNQGKEKDIWFVLPDTKEVELCKEEWKGDLYRQSARFSSIESVAQHYFGADNNEEEGYSKPWGATFANAFNQLVKGDDSEESTSTGLLGDERALDSLEESSASLHLVCQPGNGGPVEDWINVKKFHEQAGSSTPTIVVNGALDKVRDGYYAPFIFPALAKTFDFYKSFEPLVFLKPVSDKGLYGWLFKVYGEPWQVYLQKPSTIEKGGQTYLEVEDVVALVSESRPSYQECIQALLACNQNAQWMKWAMNETK